MAASLVAMRAAVVEAADVGEVGVVVAAEAVAASLVDLKLIQEPTPVQL